MKTKIQKDIVIYNAPEGMAVEVKIDKETIWLDAHQIAELY